MIRMFWWRGGPRFGNFGDELSRTIVEHFAGAAVTWSDLTEANLVAIGSLLEPHLVKPNDWGNYRGAVWGTGKLQEGGGVDLRNAEVVALRGALTIANV